MRTTLPTLLALALVAPSTALAQHHHHHGAAADAGVAPSPTADEAAAPPADTSPPPPPAPAPVAAPIDTELAASADGTTTTTTTTTVAADASAAPPPTAMTETELAPLPAADTTDDFRHKVLTLGARAGVLIPSLFNAMTPHVDVTLEVGIILPFLDGRLSIIADVGWAPPQTSGSGTDPRIGASGGPWTYATQTDELVVSLGPLFRFLPPGSMFVPYVAVLGRAYFLQTTTDGTGGGSPFGVNVEQSTEWGLVGALGGELRLGPGALLLEVSMGWSALPHRITGDTSTAALGIQVGYRLFL